MQVLLKLNTNRTITELIYLLNVTLHLPTSIVPLGTSLTRHLCTVESKHVVHSHNVRLLALIRRLKSSKVRANMALSVGWVGLG